MGAMAHGPAAIQAGRGRKDGLGRWCTAVTGAALAAGPPVLFWLGAEDPIVLVDFTWTPGSLIYLAMVVIGATMLLDLPAPWPSMQRRAPLVRWLLVLSGWAALVTLMFLIGADRQQGWLPDMTTREPGGQLDLDASFWPMVLMGIALITSLMVLASAFLAALLLGRDDLGAEQVYGTQPAHGPVPNGEKRFDLQ